MNAEHIVAALYDLALAVGGEVRVRALLTRVLQRLLFHTSFPAALALLDATPHADGVEVTLEAAVGEWKLARSVGARIVVPAALVEGDGAVLRDADLLARVEGLSPRHLVAVRLPVPAQGAIVLLGPALPSVTVPLERVFQPVLANLARAIVLCRSHEAQTRRLEAERDVARAALERFRAAVDTAADLLFLVDPTTGALVDVNGTAESALGLRRDTLGVTTLASVTQGLAPERFHAIVNDLLDGQPPATVEASHTLADGTAMAVELRFGAFRPAQGPPVVIAASRDIRARLRMEQEFLQSQKLEALGRLAGGVAHDFNNLLTGILGATGELLDAIPDNAALRESVEVIEHAASRGAALTRQLLLMSRKGRSETLAVDVGEIVRTNAAMLRRMMGEDVLLATASRADGATVLADPGKLQQVLLNLVVNARDAMPAGGQLSVETLAAELSARDAADRDGAAPGRYVVLAVTDTGCGMDDEVRRHLFEPFFTTKPEGSGTGLGLSTVYGIVRQAGGHLVVKSEPGRGSRFEVWLPRIAARSAEATPARKSITRGRGERVLVVDDDALIRAFATRLLERAGYAVRSAGDGVEALRVAAEQRPDAVLTDLVMPNMSGLELAKRLREGAPDLPVVFQSGYSNEASQITYERGRQSYLQKPYTGAQLTVMLRAILDGVDPPSLPAPGVAAPRG